MHGVGRDKGRGNGSFLPSRTQPVSIFLPRFSWPLSRFSKGVEPVALGYASWHLNGGARFRIGRVDAGHLVLGAAPVWVVGEGQPGHRPSGELRVRA